MLSLYYAHFQISFYCKSNRSTSQYRVATLKMRVGMSVEKLSKKLAAVSGRKLLSLQVSAAQLDNCILFVKGTPYMYMYTLPWKQHGTLMLYFAMMSCDRDIIMMSYSLQCFILHVGTYCRTYIWRVHIFDIGCATDHTLLDFPSTYYRFHVCKHGMQGVFRGGFFNSTASVMPAQAEDVPYQNLHVFYFPGYV